MIQNLIITDYRGLLRRKMTKDQGIDVEYILNRLNKEKYNFKVVSIEEIVTNYSYYSDLENSYIIYAGSKCVEYNIYIDHLIYLLSKKNYLIPSYDIFKSYDDKGFQELLKDELDLHSLDYKYLNSLDNFFQIESSLKYPIVIKEMKSASSKGVYKADNKEEAIKLINDICNNINKISYRNLKVQIKNILIKNDSKSQDYKGVKRFLVQEFIAGLDSDWKVLVFGQKYYCLRRKVRPNDFRASGSGLFDFVDPPEDILNFANETFEKLDVPFISLDLAYDGKKTYIVEIQGLNFGPITLVNSPHYFEKMKNKWVKVESKSNLEEEYANAYLYYINRIKSRNSK